MEKYPIINITQEMIDAANALVVDVTVNRTVASKIDTLTGILGEFVFAQYLYGNWKNNNIGNNKGSVDFNDIEIKASAFPFRDTLNLLVREDYAQKRKPKFYVQIIIDVHDRKADEIKENTKSYIAGWATSYEVDNAPKKDFGSKLNSKGGYKCFYIGIRDLHMMEKFNEAYNKNLINE